MVYLGHVAHTKEKAIDGGAEDTSDEGTAIDEPPTFDRNAPVEPIAPAFLPIDAGRTDTARSDRRN